MKTLKETLKETLKADGQTLKADNSRKKNKNRNMNLYKRFEKCMAQILYNGVNIFTEAWSDNSEHKSEHKYVIVSLDELCRRTWMTDTPTLEQRKEMDKFLRTLDEYKAVTDYPSMLCVESPMFILWGRVVFEKSGLEIFKIYIHDPFIRYFDIFLHRTYDNLEQDASKYAPTSKEDVDEFRRTFIKSLLL